MAIPDARITEGKESCRKASALASIHRGDRAGFSDLLDFFR